MTNCVAIDGDFAGNVLLAVPGAGAEPTASAVAGDIVDIARGATCRPSACRPPSSSRTSAPSSQHQGAYYVRLSVYDRPGAMAASPAHGRSRGFARKHRAAPPARARRPASTAARSPGCRRRSSLITHETTEEAMRAALEPSRRTAMCRSGRR